MTIPSNVRRRAAVGSIGALAVLLAGCSSADSSDGADAADGADQEEMSWLFSQTSGSGRLEMTDGQVTRLVMNDVDPHTIAFSDRPERLTEITDTATVDTSSSAATTSATPSPATTEEHPVS